MTGIRCGRKMGCFGQIMPRSSQNYLNNKWLPWKQNKRYLVHLTFSASLKSTTNGLQNFKSLRVRVRARVRILEITEVQGVSTKHLSMGKVKSFAVFETLF